MGRSAINPDTFRRVEGLSWAVEVGRDIYLSGVGPVDDHGSLVSGGAAAQAEQCFHNAAKVLQTAGAELSDIVKITCFATSIEAAQEYIGVRRRTLNDAVPPACTTVIVQSLMVPGMLLEVDAIAVRINDAACALTDAID